MWPDLIGIQEFEAGASAGICVSLAITYLRTHCEYCVVPVACVEFQRELRRMYRADPDLAARIEEAMDGKFARFEKHQKFVIDRRGL